MKIAVIGTGISGLAAAWLLRHRADVTVYEQDSRAGGHTHTVDTPGGPAVDTGFIVYNERNYPRFTRLLAELGVASRPSTMGFSVHSDRTGLEYNGSSLRGLFVQPNHAFSPVVRRKCRRGVCMSSPLAVVNSALQPPLSTGCLFSRRTIAVPQSIA